MNVRLTDYHTQWVRAVHRFLRKLNCAHVMIRFGYII